jgi:hypothetical protein
MELGVVVWSEGQVPSRIEEFVRCSHALVFHYLRCFFGPQFGMKGRTA